MKELSAHGEDQPHLPVSWLASVRHYRNIRKVLPRLERLLGEFNFTSIAERLAGDGKWFRASAPLPDVSPQTVARG